MDYEHLDHEQQHKLDVKKLDNVIIKQLKKEPTILIKLVEEHRIDEVLNYYLGVIILVKQVILIENWLAID